MGQNGGRTGRLPRGGAILAPEQQLFHLEPRSLPSAGITRPRRYYEPLRHPREPSLSLTGVQLVVPDLSLGLPVVPALSLCTCCRHYQVRRLSLIFAH